jgi:DNA-binding MarR family transcriptional regulator
MEGRIGYELKLAQQAFCAAVDEALRAVSLSNAQYAILAILEDGGSLSSAELARRLFVTPQTMNEIVAGLAERSLVTRTAHPQHGRIRLIGLSQQGVAVVAEAHAKVRAIEERMLASLAGSEQGHLVRLLRICAEALTAAAAQRSRSDETRAQAAV